MKILATAFNRTRVNVKNGDGRQPGPRLSFDCALRLRTGPVDQPTSPVKDSLLPMLLSLPCIASFSALAYLRT